MTQYDTTRVIFMQVDSDEPIVWAFPTVPGTPLEKVHSEIRTRLGSDPKVDLQSVQVQYPTGPWNQPLDRDGLILGADGTNPAPPVPNQSRRPQPSSFVQDSSESRKVQVHQQAPLPSFLGPLTDEAGPPVDPAQDLDRLLSAWASKHRLSSTAYYAFLASAQLQHASRLLKAARPTH